MRQLCFVALLAIVLLRPTAAAADPIPIPITSGTIDITSPTSASGALRLVGTGGFSFTSGLTEGAFLPSGCCLEGGQTSSFFGNWIGTSVRGTIMYRDETFTDIGSPNSVNHASVTFSGSSFVAPPAPTAGVSTTVVESFTLSGMFRGTPGDGHGFGVPTLFTTFSGSGIGRLSLVSTPVSPSRFVWQARDAHLDIMAPTPEPTSLLLLGLGAAGVWILRAKGNLNA